MVRTLTLGLALSLLLPAAFAGAQDASPVLVASLDPDRFEEPRLGEQAAPIDVGDEAYAEDFEDEEYADEDVEFCGGGEESIVDLAYYELETAPEEARRMLVDALRSGEVEDWQRGHALAYLAEAQLRLGQHRSAIINYRKALQIDAEGVTQSARVGLATALYLAGARVAAQTEARAAADAVCSDRWSQVPCYAAQRVLALTERGEARATAARQADQLREAHTQYASAFADVDTRLHRDS